MIISSGAIYKSIDSFGKISKTGAYLLYPYMAWVSFTSILNFIKMFLVGE
ncbi:MAG: tryptophan-rich sensory protein [Candidatus Woesebacteria bacterium]|nr:MAG: tryptophan-rich sensory protein [Candidatus Woesebacteria bacterium]